MNYFKLENLYATGITVSLKPALINIQLQNIAALAKQADGDFLEQFHLPERIGTDSLLTEELSYDAIAQIKDLNPRYGYAIHLDDDQYPFTQKTLYNALITSNYTMQIQDKHITDRIQYHNLPHPATNTHIFNLNTNFGNLPPKLPTSNRITQFRLVLNGLATARRLTPIGLNHHNKPHIYGDHVCYLCGLHDSQDSIQHIYSPLCPSYLHAWTKTMQHLQLPTDIPNLAGRARLMHDIYNPRTLAAIVAVNTMTWLQRTDNLRMRRQANASRFGHTIFIKSILNLRKFLTHIPPLPPSQPLIPP